MEIYISTLCISNYVLRQQSQTWWKCKVSGHVIQIQGVENHCFKSQVVSKTNDYYVLSTTSLEVATTVIADSQRRYVTLLGFDPMTICARVQNSEKQSKLHFLLSLYNYIAPIWRQHHKVRTYNISLCSKKVGFFFFPVPVCAVTVSGVPGCTFVSMNRFSTLCGWLVQRQGWRVKGWIWSSEQARSARADSWLDYQRPLEK
jgi:hypothetical protein